MTKEYAPTNEDASKLQIAKQNQIKDAQRFVRNLLEEKQVKVYGDPIYEQYLGKEYTYFHNHIPVSIRFDGKYYSFPESIAKHLQKKLQKISRDNTSKNVQVKL